MNKSVRIRDILVHLGYSPPPDATYHFVFSWMAWYQGIVSNFHEYFVYNGIQQVKRTRATLGMAKKVCEDWANLLLNEKVEIKTGSEAQDKILSDILQVNNFRVRGNQLIELSYALGTGALVEYKGPANNVLIDYVRAEMIYPLSWDNGDVTECAFGSHRTDGMQEYIYIQIHRLGRPEVGEVEGAYYLENLRYTLDGTPREDPEPPINTGSRAPLFQLIKPNICNNIDLDSPLGISVYANAVDQLKGCDLVYDSYLNEFVLGKKRIIVPASMAQMQMGTPDAKGAIARPIFDVNDTIFYAIPDSSRNSGEGQKLTENNMEIRANEHELGLQRSLDSLSLKVGMGNNRYKYESGGVKTATEVISEKSDLYQNLRKNELILESALKGMVSAIFFLLGQDVEPSKVSVAFDDSIITDEQTDLKNDLQLVTAGIMSKAEFRVKHFGETMEQAQQALKPVEAGLFEGEE